MTRTIPQPAWAPTFHKMITQLQTHDVRAQRGQDKLSREFWEEAFDEAELPGLEADTATQSDDADAAPPAERRPPFLHALAALHLARTFQPLKQLYATGALTLYDPGTATLIAPLAKVLTTATLPKSVTVASADSALCEKAGLLLVKPAGDGAAGHKSFIESMRNALFDGQPCFCLLQPGIVLPQDLAKLLPKPLTPPPLDRAALRALLHVMFSSATAGQLDGAMAALPKEFSLDNVSSEALALAFRGAKPQHVIAALVAQRAPSQKEPSQALTFDQFDAEQPAVTVARQTAADLALWRAGQLPWADIPNGLLLYGPPGTGKTLLARALASEAKIPLIEASLSEWQQNASLGPFLERMQSSFAQARTSAPSIFFLDEIDAIGTRAERSHNSSYSDQVIAAFLIAVSRLRETEGVILIGATNRLEGLDPAILRPGRFDLKLSLGLPSRAGIEAILAKLLAETPISAASRERLSRKALGLSPAEIDGALRQSKAACRAAGQPLSEEALAAALESGGAQPTADLSWRIAVHEAGHAALGIRLGMTITRITVGPRAGLVDWTPRPEEGVVEDFLDRIALQLAGRAAEEILLGNASAGAGGSEASDLAEATRLALDLELRSGMGGSGLLYWGSSNDLLLSHPELRRHVEAHLQTGLSLAKSVIQRMPVLIEGLAQVALREGELSGPVLHDWVETIRDFDPDVREDPPGSLIIFPGHRKDGLERV